MLDRVTAILTAPPEAAGAGAAFELTMPGPRARLIFRARDEEAIRRAGRAFGVDLPRAACRFKARGTRAALWLGPDEWMLLVEGGDPVVDAGAVEAELDGLAHSIVDVSHRSVTLRISGPKAAEVLLSGCPLDLSEHAFPAGMCTRTVFAKAEIILARSGPASFEIDVWRSFAPYIRDMLDVAAREFC